jgi:predicted ATPase/DNA-binding winged helix-turn-helix (wHTH) protein
VSSEYRFVDFTLSPTRQLLTQNGRAVRVGSRALAILQLLIERHGSLVTKQDIFDRVWPKLQVEEENIRIHVAALRRALGDDQAEQRLIVTEHGRGYRFIAPIQRFQAEDFSTDSPDRVQSSATLPVRLTSIVGRDEIIEQLVTVQSENRLVTIVGVGGIGKTTVAVSLAYRISDTYTDGAVLVDLAPLADPEFIPAAMASQLGIPRSAHDPQQVLFKFIRAKRMLIVLDNCEHLIDASAHLAQRILACAPGVHVIATSREPLGVPTEHLYRLPPLETPSKTATSTAVNLREYSAVRLFLERASARRTRWEPSNAYLESIAEVCRRLDGLPLAIELAAAAIDTVGAAGIAAALDWRFALLTGGYRTAAPRHRTLRAVMDWSYDFLPANSQAVLRRLSVFRGGFTLEAAEEVVACARITKWEVVEHLTSLTEKSLVSTGSDHFVPEFRLLETVREYVAEKFLASGEADTTMQLLAERCHRVFGQAFDESKIGISPERRSLYLRQVDDLRASLNWTFASETHVRMGTALAIAATPTLDSLGLFTEAYHILRTAIDKVEKTKPPEKQDLMQLYALMAPMSMWKTLDGSEGEGACKRLLDLSNETGRVDFQLIALRGLFYVGMLSGQNALARNYSAQMAEVGEAAGDRDACTIARQRFAAMCTVMGEHEVALRAFEAMALDTRTSAPVDAVRYIYEPVCSQKTYLSRTLWCMGRLESALEEARGALERATRLGHIPTQFVTIIQAAALIPLWTGPLASAEYAVRLCSETAGDDPSRKQYARLFMACLQIQQGDATVGVKTLTDEILSPTFDIDTLAPNQELFYAALAEGLYRTDAFDEADTVVDRALAHSAVSGGVWFDPELLRIKGCVLAAQAAPSMTVESVFENSLSLARQQRGLYWELRTAFSLARYWASLCRIDPAHALLQSVFQKFTQGFDLPDLALAHRFITELQARRAGAIDA